METYIIYQIASHINNRWSGYNRVIQEYKNKELAFEWASTNYEELYEMSVDFNDYTNSTSTHAADYMHINSIDKDPKDGNIIASFRDIDCILKINTNNGDVLWRLGGKGDYYGAMKSLFRRTGNQ